MSYSEQDMKDKSKAVVKFIQNLVAIEEAMEPLKEQRSDLKKNFVDNGWLSKEEMRTAVKCLRMLRTGEDFENLAEMYKKLSINLGIESGGQ